jgi:hypothetical protein
VRGLFRLCSEIRISCCGKYCRYIVHRGECWTDEELEEALLLSLNKYTFSISAISVFNFK